MIEQAGVYSIVLYEAKELIITYNYDNTARAIANSGDVITLDNSSCNTIDLLLVTEIRRSQNNNLQYKFGINWKQFGFSAENLEVIEKFCSSIYGWVALIEFQNLEKKITTNPYYFDEASINNNLSNHYNLNIENRVFGTKLINYVPVSEESITADSDTVTADSDTVDTSGGTI